MDIFDLIGPIMVGPSSSHTAGAVRIGQVARRLLGTAPVKADIYLHGSFADTGSGHGTDRALIAGLLGMAPDDGRIPRSFEYAAESGLNFEFFTAQLRNAHPNSALIRLTGSEGSSMEVVGASIGGGRIQVREINGMKLNFSAELPTLIIKNNDQPGSVADVSRVLAELNINIGTFQVNRNARGGTAIMVIECDAPIENSTVQRMKEIPGILNAVYINPERGGSR